MVYTKKNENCNGDKNVWNDNDANDNDYDINEKIVTVQVVGDVISKKENYFVPFLYYDILKMMTKTK